MESKKRSVKVDVPYYDSAGVKYKSVAERDRAVASREIMEAEAKRQFEEQQKRKAK